MWPVCEEIFDEIDENELWNDFSHRRESFEFITRFVKVCQAGEDDELVLYKV